MYYQQPPPEPPVPPPPPPAPSRREKKRLDIIDPRTGVNVISDLRDPSSAELKPLRNEVYMFHACCSVIYFEHLTLCCLSVLNFQCITTVNALCYVASVIQMGIKSAEKS